MSDLWVMSTVQTFGSKLKGIGEWSNTAVYHYILSTVNQTSVPNTHFVLTNMRWIAEGISAVASGL